MSSIGHRPFAAIAGLIAGAVLDLLLLFGVAIVTGQLEGGYFVAPEKLFFSKTYFGIAMAALAGASLGFWFRPSHDRRNGKWAPGLIVFGLFGIAIGLATLFVVWKLVLLPTWHPDYAAKKLELMFLRHGLGCVTWPALLGVLFGIALLIRGVFIHPRKSAD